MSGTINLALSQQFDMDGKPLSGGLLYFYQAGTVSTPQDAFQDTGLTIKWPNPLRLDASGRIPMFYLADGYIKVRLTDKTGLTVFAQDGLLVIGPSSGTSTGSAVDPTKISATGDIKPRFGNETALAGWVRCNGNTIGPAGSGASEATGDQCQALFEFLWSFTSLAVVPSRGANAHADWLAGTKLVTLPDLRARALAGVDGMGNTSITPLTSRLSSGFWGADAAVLGNAGGVEKATLAAANLAQHSHSGSTLNQSADHRHAYGSATPLTTTTQRDPAIPANAKALEHTHKAGIFYAGAAGSGPGIGYLADHIAAGGDSGTNTRATSGASGGSPGQATDLDHVHQVTVNGTTDIQNTNHNHAYITGMGDSPIAASPTPIATATPSMVVTFYIKL